MKFDLRQIYKKDAVPRMLKSFGYPNVMAVPKIEKVVVNTGIGSVKDDEQRKRIAEHLAVVTGQKVSERPAKKSISSFKIAKGSIIGYSVTLRGKRMYDFLNKLLFVALTRQRDFRGLNPDAVDEAGNLTIGLKDHLIFPEMVNEDLKSAFGLSITVVTTAASKEKSIEFLKLMGFPFKK